MKKLKLKIFAIVFFVIALLFAIYFCYPAQLKVSVVMPVFNREKLVGRAIDSILNQTYKNFEFIIVDDGSTDSTPNILQDYAQKDSRIKLFKNAVNQGVAYSRQKGLDMAKGQYVAIMDSDDWSTPDRLAKSVAFLDDHPEITAMSGYILGLGNDAIPNVRPTSSSYTISQKPGFYEVGLTFYNSFPNVSAMFRRDFVVKNKIHYDFRLVATEDYDFWAQIILAGGRLASISEVLVYVRFHSLNSSKYYQHMNADSPAVHQKLLSCFFEPSEKDLKFSYNLWEKCHLLKKMKDVNPTKKCLPQEWLDQHYADVCPENVEDFLFFVHPEWADFLKISGDTIKRFSSTDEGTFKLKGHELIIEWKKWPAEVFEKQEDHSYKYKGKELDSHLTFKKEKKL